MTAIVLPTPTRQSLRPSPPRREGFGIDGQDGGGVQIGANVTLGQLAADPLIRERYRVADVVRAFDPSAVPCLADWECIHTPGHTPGHVAFFRRNDRVLITGDALLTINVNSLWDLLRNKQRVSGPSYISTWNWAMAKVSVATLAQLEPDVLACGHGVPMTGPETARDFSSFADRFAAKV